MKTILSRRPSILFALLVVSIGPLARAGTVEVVGAGAASGSSAGSGAVSAAAANQWAGTLSAFFASPAPSIAAINGVMSEIGRLDLRDDAVRASLAPVTQQLQAAADKLLEPSGNSAPLAAEVQSARAVQLGVLNTPMVAGQLKVSQREPVSRAVTQARQSLDPQARKALDEKMNQMAEALSETRNAETAGTATETVVAGPGTGAGKIHIALGRAAPASRSAGAPMSRDPAVPPTRPTARLAVEAPESRPGPWNWIRRTFELWGASAYLSAGPLTAVGYDTALQSLNLRPAEAGPASAAAEPSRPVKYAPGMPFVGDIGALADNLYALPPGSQRAVVAEIMTRNSDANGRKIREKLATIPPGKWEPHRLLVATIMAADGDTYEQVLAAEKTIPAGLWPTQRGVVAGILIARKPNVGYEQVAASEKLIPRGQWAEDDQRIVIAAIKESFGHVSYEDVSEAEKLIPEGLWPMERHILAAHIAYFVNQERPILELSPEDAAANAAAARWYEKIQDALRVAPEGRRQAWAAAIMAGRGIPAQRIVETESEIPGGRWPEQRLVMAAIMTATKAPYAKVEAAEREIPAGLWERQRGVLAVLMASYDLKWEGIAKIEKAMTPGEWAEGDQRIVIAAIKAHTTPALTDGQIRDAESKLPAGVWPNERGIIGALTIRFEESGAPKAVEKYASENAFVGKIGTIARDLHAVPPGNERATVAEIMHRNAKATSSRINAALAAIPPGKWEHERLLVATLMAVSDLKYEEILEIEKTIPEGLWPAQRGAVAAILGARPRRLSKVTYEDVAASEKSLPPGQWVENDQSILIAAVKEAFGHLAYEDVAEAEKLIPDGLWPMERHVLAAHIAYFANFERPLLELSPEDAVSGPADRWYEDIQAALPVVPKGRRQAWAATIMVGRGVPAKQIVETDRTIPSGKWPEQRLVMATIMTAMKAPYAKVEAAEREIPAGLWESQRGILAAIMAANNIKWERIEGLEKAMAPGEWAEADQRIVIAAVKAFVAAPMSDDYIRDVESRLPEGAWPKERGIIAALTAHWGDHKKGLAPEDLQQ